MKLMQRFAAIAAFALAFAVNAEESGRIVIAADSSSGTYAEALGEIIGVCSREGVFDVAPAQGVTGGAVGNLQALVDNKAQAAFLHSDVFAANAQADPSYKKFQTLVALWPEPIHVLTLRESKTSKKGWSLGKQEFNSLVDAREYKVGAAGGGVKTAQWLQGQGRGGFDVVAYQSGKEVIDALDKGDVAVAVFVGAAPLPNLSALPNKQKYKLIPIGEAIANNVKGLYRPASINYNTLTNGPIQTLAPMATIMTRKYSTGRKLESQRQFRDCFNRNLGELQDNASAKWQSVEANDHGVLDWYEIPAASAAPATDGGNVRPKK